MFQDETGFTLYPRLGRGWAKVGQRLRVATTSQHRTRLNLSGWVAPLVGRRGLLRVPQGDRKGFLSSLSHLCRTLKGYTLWVYTDRAPWHRGQDVEAFVDRHHSLHLEYLPPYQPALNMQERIWRQVRYEATTGQWFEDLEDTWQSVTHCLRHWSPKKVKQLCKLV